MSRRAAKWAALAVLAVLTLATFVVLERGWFDSGPPLTLHLRCPDGATGTLSIAIVPRSGPPPVEQHVDLGAACAAGRIDLPRRRDEADLRVTLVRRDGQTVQVRAQHGTDIQRDRDGFHVIMRIMDDAPFLANARL